MKVKEIFIIIFIVSGFVFGVLSSCNEDIQIGNLAVDMKYKDTKQFVITGLDARVGEFVFSKSSLPLTFEIENVTEANGGSTKELFEEIKVVIYTNASSPTDSEEMKKEKRDTVLLPALEIEKHTGIFVLHEGNKIKEGTYSFDVKITNVSGEVMLSDALVLEVLPYKIFSFREFGGAPTIEHVADSPNQIVFKAFDLENDTIIPAENFNFMEDRSSGFEGVFAGDTPEGEIWNIEFPLKQTETRVVINGKSMYLNFALGVPGKYVINMYK